MGITFAIRKVLNISSRYRSSSKALALPIAMQAEMVCGCNIRCKMCALPKITRKKGMMDFYTFKKIYCQIKPETVVLTGYGEALLNPDIIRIIEYAKNNGSIVHMDTNATLLDKNMAFRIIKSGVDWIRTSVDAANKMTYDKIRVGSNYGLVWSNISSLIRLKEKTESKTPIIDLTCVVQPENFIEIEAILEKSYRLGIGIRFLMGIDYCKSTYFHWEKIREGKVTSVLDYAITRSNELGLSEANKTLKKTKETYLCMMKDKKLKPGPCFWPWSSVFITWDGKVLPCCYFYNSEVIMGSVTRQRFDNIWNNRHYREFRKNLLKDREHYTNCRYCGTNESELFNKVDRYLKFAPSLGT